MAHADKYKIGDFIGKYEVQGVLGTGGFGTVYRAYDPSTDGFVAIKVLNFPDDEDLVKRFRLEVKIAARLRHKNIVTVYTFEEEQGALVMEYLDGKDLRKLLAEHAEFTLYDKLLIMREAEEGLQYAHEQGVVHRDVTPSNIMRLANGSAKIMDFGVARLRDATTRLTQANYIIGNAPYLAPELFTSAGIASDQCDIWSFGVVFYEFLSGANPFQAENLEQVVFKVNWSDPRPISVAASGVPEALDTVFQKMLARSPKERYRSFEELRFDLHPLILEQGRVEAESLLQQAEKLKDIGRNEAFRLARRALDLDPSNGAAAKLVKALRRNSAQPFETMRRQEIDRLAGQIREYVAKGNLPQASLDLAAAESRYPGESAWTELQADIDARQAELKRETEIAALAEGLRGRLDQELQDTWYADLEAPGGGTYPIAPVWDVLRRAIERLDQARLKYAGEAVWDALQTEIGQRQTGLEQDITEIIRSCSGLLALDWNAKQLSMARARYPSEPFWGILQKEIDVRREAIDRASKIEFEARIRECLIQEDFKKALELLKAARNRHPGDDPWGDRLKSEVDARQADAKRRRELDGVEQDVREQLEFADQIPNQQDRLYPIEDQSRAFQQAGAVVARARAQYGSESRLDGLETEIAERRTEWKRKVVRQADALLKSSQRETLWSLSHQIRRLSEIDPKEPLWVRLQAKLDVGNRVRSTLQRDVREAALELNTARATYPEEELWPILQAELDERQAEVEKASGRADSLLAEGRPHEAIGLIEGRFAGESQLEPALARARAALERLERDEIENIAESVQRQLEEQIQEAESQVPFATCPIASIWDGLRTAIERLEQARVKYPGEAAWDSVRARIAERQKLLEHGMLDIVRTCSSPISLDRNAKQLNAARARYPSEPFWPTLQKEIDARREAIERASKDEFVASIRGCLTENDLTTARERLQAARNRHPEDEGLWNELRSEIDTRQVQAQKREEQEPIPVLRDSGGASSVSQQESLKTRAAVVGGSPIGYSGGVALEPANGELRTYPKQQITDSPAIERPKRDPGKPDQATEILTRRPVIKWLIVAAAGITLALTTLAVIHPTGPVPLRVDPKELGFIYPGESLSKSLTLSGGRSNPQVLSSQPWLLASVARNTTPIQINVQVDPRGLHGDQFGQLRIVAGTDASETTEVRISLKENAIAQKPLVTLKAIPAAIFFPNYRIGEPAPSAQIVSVNSVNPAEGLHFSITSPPSCSWLNLPASGITPATFRASVNTSLLRPNTRYTCTLNIDAPNIVTATVSASLAVFPPTVNPQPPSMPSTLSVSPSSLPFGNYQLGGPTPSPQSISVSSSNPATGRAFSAALGTNCGWLNLSETTGKTSSQLSALVNTSGLAVGNYSCAITFAGADSNPPPVVATLTVVAPPPPIVDCRAPTYTGLHYGTFTWSGPTLASKAELVIGGPDQNLGDGGIVRGQRLPGCDVNVTGTSGVIIEEGPSTKDGFRRIKVRNGSSDPLSSFEIHWQAK
jgi:serine/threonine protein kinase